MTKGRKTVRQATDIANKISKAIEGEPMLPVLVALSMMIGEAAALADEPNFDECMKFVRLAAGEEFNNVMAAQ